MAPVDHPAEQPIQFEWLQCYKKVLYDGSRADAGEGVNSRNKFTGRF